MRSSGVISYSNKIAHGTCGVVAAVSCHLRPFLRVRSPVLPDAVHTRPPGDVIWIL
jgi:hypothetical protein